MTTMVPRRRGHGSLSDRAIDVPPRTGTYLFAVGRESLELSASMAGIPGLGPVRSVGAHGTGLQAVAADASLDVLAPLRHPQAGTMEQLAMIARAHDSTVRGLAQSGPVLPLPLGTLLGNDDAVRDVLRRRADELRHELDRLTGHAEWEVTVQLGASREDPADASSGDQRGGGRDVEARGVTLDALRERRQQRHALAQEVHAALAAHAVEARRLGDRGPDRCSAVLLRGAYLVADTTADRFHEAVASIQERCSEGEVDVTGPWPAYHFLRLDLTV